MVGALTNRLLTKLIAATLIGAAMAAEASQWSSFEEADRVYHETILEGVRIEERVAELEGDAGGSALERAQRLYLASLLQWRHGDREAALSSVDEALDIERHGALLHQRGRLLEALSRIDEAIEAYREALPLLSGSSRADTELRMALLIASERGETEPLLSLAESGDAAVRNRVAMVLAVLGHAGEAGSLYSLPSAASVDRQWRHALRQTEWSLWARDAVKAREAAWRAVDLAGSEQDRLYAVALLTEAHRQADALPELVDALEDGRDVGGDSRALWVSLLREIDRPEDALAALEGSAEHEPPAVKRQFLGIYRESGRSAEMVAELERLMVADPDETIWPQGLAEFYLERGDRVSAESAWRAFVARAEMAPALLDGAAVMLKLGFDELALAAAAKAQRDTVVNRAGRDAALDRAARFQFELYLQRGRWDKAREVLESLEAATEVSDPMRQSIAMAYERLNLPAEALRVMTALVEARDSSDNEASVEASQYLAQLLIANGDAQQAVDLLLAALPEASPSQLRLLHTRLIAAARTTGLEDALVADLTAKLDDGRATQSETQLLIEMHIRAQDETAALALIDTLYGQAGADPVAKLQQVAVVHRSLGNWQTYDDTLAQLAERDADNAVFHIRSRIINYIDRLRFEAEDDQEVSDTLIALLEQYLAVSEVGADREFVAGVLAMGGQRETAIDVYREILAVDPSRLDSYLEIGSQLVALQQAPQAVGMYQYLLESSGREEISWVALDGILNMQPDRATLEWARRTALLRLSAAPEQFEYYRQLADLSIDVGDNDRQLAALYNGLAAGAELRLATLRELLRATDGAGAAQAASIAIFNRGINQGAAVAFGLPPGVTIAGGLSASWQERHVEFGRRLQALGLALPPGVHLSLGKAMIEAGDTDAALRAVNQAVEQTGSDELVAQAAGIFQQAGDDLSAHRLFEQALRNDPDNLDLLVDTAWSNERLGHKDRAGELFLAGLTTLLTRQPLRNEEILFVAGLTQPAEVPETDQLDSVLLDEGKELFPLTSSPSRTHSIEYRQYYILLRNGLVRMLLGDPQQRHAVLSRLQDDYASTLAFVHARQSAGSDSNQFPPRPTGLPRLANYPRLRLQAQLMRYLAYTFGDYAAVNDLDETLLTLFPEDRQLPEILVAHRAEWGSFAYLDWLENSGVLTASQKEALARHWRELAVDTDDGLLAVRTTSQEVLPPDGEAALQEALDRALRSGDATETVRVVKQLAATDSIWETLESVEPHLSSGDKKLVADHVIAVLQNNVVQANNSLRIDIRGANLNDLRQRPRPWAARLEDWSGKAVFDDQRLLDVIDVSAEQQSGDSGPGSIDPWFIYQALSDANRDKWISASLAERGFGSAGPAMAFNLISPLLQVECDDATAEMLITIVREFEGFFNPGMLPLGTIDIHPANVPLARELEALARKKYPDAYLERQPDPVFEPNYLRAEGRIEEALHKLVDIYLHGRLPSNNPAVDRDAIAFVRGYYRQLVAGNELALIDILKSRDLSSPEAIRQRSLLLMRIYRHHYGADPQRLLLPFVDLLKTDPENRELLQVVAGIRAWEGERFAAQELKRTQLGDTGQTGADGSLRPLLQASLRTALELDHPIAAVAYGNSLGLGTAEPEPEAETETAVAQQPTGSPDAIVRALNGDDPVLLQRESERLLQRLRLGEWTLWEKTRGVHVSLSDVIAMSVNSEQVAAAFRQGQEDLPDREMLLSTLAGHPLGVEILESWFATVRGRMLEAAQALVEALAEAHVNNGTAADRFAELSAAIREQRAGDKEISLWLAIGSRVPELASRDAADAALASYLRLETTYRPSLLFGLTQFLAVRGDADGALRGFQSLIDWVHDRPPPESVGLDDNLSIHDVLTSAREMLDAPTYRRLLRDVFDRVKPWEDYLLPMYSEFVLSQFDAATDRQAFYRMFEADVGAAIEILGGSAEHGLQSLYAAFMDYRRGDTLAALDGLQRAMETRASMLKLRVSGPLLGFHTSGVVDQPQYMARQQKEFDYRRMLGLNAGISSTEADSLGMRIAFAVMLPKGDLPGLLFAEVDPVGLRQIDVAVRERIEAGDVERNLGIEILLGLARAYREQGADAELERLFDELQAQLANADVRPRTAAAIANLAGDLNQGLGDVGLEKALLSKGAIEPEHMAAVLRRIAAAEGETAALDLGSGLLEFTLNDALMDELIALADGNARSAQAEQWRELQQQAGLARAELDRMDTSAIGVF